MSGSVYSLLLINDKEERELLEKTLTALGVSFKSAQDSKECIGLMSDLPDLHFLFLDVRLVNSGETNLASHSMIRDKKVPIFLFSMKSDYALLKTCQHLPIYEYVEESPSYRKQLSSSLKKLAEKIQLQRKIEALEQSQNKLKVSHQNLLSEVKNQQSKFVQEKNILDFMRSFWAEKNKGKSFFDCFSASLNSTQVVEYGYFFCLNNEKTKVFCQDFGVDFLGILPVLNLSDTGKCLSIAAQEACIYTATKNLEGEVGTCILSDSSGEVEHLFVYQTNSVFDLNQSELSEFLNAEYRGQISSSKSLIDPWEFSQNVHRMGKNIIKVSFDKLTHEILREKFQFLGRQFKSDLLNGLSLCFNSSVVFCFGSTGSLFICGNEDKMLEITDRYVKNLKYWNYFEDSSNSFTKMVTPVVEDYSDNLEFVKGELFGHKPQIEYTNKSEINA